MTKTMAEVLAEHRLLVIDRACSCGDIFYDTRTTLQEAEVEHGHHQAAALTAAGYGLVADAKREAWDEGADASVNALNNHISGDRTAKLINPYRKVSNDDQ